MAILRVSLHHYDAELNTDVCDRYTNADITLTLRVFLRKRNPAGDRATGTYNDYGDANAPLRRIIRWDAESWASWKRRYQSTGQSFWSGKFWLITPANHATMDKVDRGINYRPNAWCRLRLCVQEHAASAHTTIDVVRLAADERWFGSHAQLYDSRDLEPVNKGASMLQRAHVHEIGHLLGLGHSAEHRQACTDTGDTNSDICYGTVPEERDEVMGGGMNLNGTHAAPWMRAMEALTRLDQYAWAPMMRRHYPRSPQDIAQNLYPCTRPNRG